MTADTATNLLAIVISVVSLTLSVALAIRQNRTASAGYALPVVLEIFDQFRTPEFFNARQYVYDQLHRDFDPPVAYTDLPEDARARVRIVAGRYDDLGKLVAHGIVSEDLIIGSNGTAIRRVWKCVAPFVLAERQKSSTETWRYLEHLACCAASRPPEMIYEDIGLLLDGENPKPSAPRARASVRRRRPRTLRARQGP